MRRLPLYFLLAGLWAPMHAVNAADAAETDDAPKREMLQHLANDVVLPLTSEFVSASGKLVEASKSYCAAPAQSKLSAVQAAWRAAQAAWQPLEILQIGPTIERRTQRQVNAWPVRPQLLAPLLDGSPVNAERVEALGAAAKGLPAMEYLLFGQDKAPSGTRCDVLQALATQVHAEAQGLATDWREPNSGFARQMAEAGQHPQDGAFASADQALSDVLNLLIAGIDAIKIRKLGKPLEKSGDEKNDGVALDRIESWRSGTSLDNIRDNLRGFEMAFFGAGKDGIGLDDYLAKIERPGLARVIRQELNTSTKALAAVRPPLQNALGAQRKQVEKLHKSLSHLQHMLETEVAEALKVDLSFNANDGD